MLVPIPPHALSQHLINTQNLSWVDAQSGESIKNAVIAGGKGKDSVQICHAKFHQAMYPGRVTAKGCAITYATKLIVQPHFQVLTVKDPQLLKWQAHFDLSPYHYSHFSGVLPANSQLDGYMTIPVIGGYESQSPNYFHPLYICRTIYQNSITVGKVIGQNCDVAGDDKEQVSPTYEVLGMKMSIANAK
ncbi:MAG: DUF3421 domain-containing protein [Gammaproteobacteria bacterium]|nr:DUF3421 domain-containing protein [Gammaproteobacteria bacterium]